MKINIAADMLTCMLAHFAPLFYILNQMPIVTDAITVKSTFSTSNNDYVITKFDLEAYNSLFFSMYVWTSTNRPV